uniref:GIY-YIG-like endonuclease n=1 Tax=Mimivirus LCMiAC02 TaxID=2506609 RepID=A0A481Z1K5_9VIRU|nr:MAG: GIY-YIG-like endonuclease [Mimivirus LCMiAC02]
MNNQQILDNFKKKIKELTSEYGVIYKCTSKKSKKSYIGQAANRVSANVPWGATGRWKSHIRDAYNKQNRCKVLNSAIRKYGSDDFIIETLGKYPYEYLDIMEEIFIYRENTLVPNGYNLTTGGAKGKDSEHTRALKRKSRLGKKHSEETKRKISMGQIGNRRKTKKRWCVYDNNLPKYISAIRINNVIGYRVVGFPIGITEAKYVPAKNFMKSKIQQENYALALEHLNNLKIKYADIITQIAQQRKEYEEEKNKDWFEIKKQKMIDKLPEYIYPVYNKNRLRGYYVEFVPTHDNKTHPKKDFDFLSSNHKNLNAAKRYIKSLEILNKDIVFMQNNTKFPKYVAYTKNRDKKIIGYRINNYPIRDENGVKIGHIKKKFCSTKETMESKYEKTINYLKNYCLSKNC